MEIKLNTTLLNKTLSKVVKKAYEHLGTTYLTIEELRVQLEETEETASENSAFDYYIVGHYGVENTFDRSFDFMVSSNWDYSFLAGYFNCLVDKQDGAFNE